MAEIENNLRRQQSLEAKFEKFLEAVKDKPGFVKAGIGFRRVGGERTDEICFSVFVKEKLPPEKLTAEAMLPSEYDGERIDVVEYREPKPQSKTTRPLVGGIQCTPSKSYYGTLGCCARRTSDGKGVLLSNYHVLYGDDYEDGDTVYQPKQVCGCNGVGENARGVRNTRVDAAIAKLDGADGTNKVKDIGVITGTTNPTVGMAVQKTGARTDHTQGTITYVYPDPSKHTGFHVEAANPRTDRFSDHGDSGSVILNDSLQVVGLLWGGVDEPPFFTACSNILDVMSELGITMPNPNWAANDEAEVVEGAFYTIDPRLQQYEDELNKSANGRGVLRVIKSQVDEVGDLVHHNRAVTVAWNENKGPEFVKAYEVAQHDPTKQLPKTVAGVELQTMLTNMGDVLKQQGSPALQHDIELYKDSILSVAAQVDSLQQLTDVINGKAIHCWLLDFVWQQMWTPSSEFYLPTAAKNGLKIPDLGIDIPPFATIKIGDLPELTMFKEPVLGYMKILLSSTQVSGLDTVQKGDMTCKENGDGSVNVDLSLTFGKIVFSGDYTVSAGGGIGGCAIAAASTVLGGGTGDMLADGAGGLSPVDQHNNLALWYRSPLAESQNGQTLLGAHEEHNDTIYDLQQNSPKKNLYWESLRENNVQSTTEAVTTATQYYHDQQTGQLTEEQADADPPTIGSVEQYGSGQAPYAYMLAMARAAKGSEEDTDNRYAKLEKAMTYFLGAIDWVQKKHPGEHSIGGEGGLLDIIAKAPPQAIKDHVMSLGSYDIVDPKTDEIIVTVEPPTEPLDHGYYRHIYKQHATRYGISDAVEAASSVDGTFSDEGINVTLKTSLTISGNLGDDPQVNVSALSAEIGALKIKLEQTKGWWPGLYDKVSNWIANTFVTDILKSHINDALSSQSMRDNFAHIIEGVLKQKG
jgi:hypothetical protein